MTEVVNENWVKLLDLRKKNFIALKLITFNDEINNFFSQFYVFFVNNNRSTGCEKKSNCVAVSFWFADIRALGLYYAFDVNMEQQSNPFRTLLW